MVVKKKEEKDFTVKELIVYATDGYPLSAVLYTPRSFIKSKIIMASATGVPQPFYRRFAEYCASQGHQIITFDYRGIGKSAPKKMKGFEMSYLDWGVYDLSGIIDFMADGQLPLFVVGHSYGGQALGLTKNHNKVKAMYCFGTGAGWAGYMPLKERFKVQVMWNIVFPPMVALNGYLPWSKLKMGSDLPMGVYKEWRKWCQNPTYFFADPHLKSLKDHYANVKSTIYAVSALDDDWALPSSRRAFMQHYSSADMHFINISADEYNLREIGHMGYFRKGAEKIWKQVLHSFETLDNHTDVA